jgi:putative membrane protein
VSWLKTLLAAVIGLIILAVGILFTVHNTEPVAIDLVFVQLPEMTLSRLRSAQRKVSASRQEIEKLRAAALKDSG